MNFEFNNSLQCNLEEGLEKIWNNIIEDDIFNNLIFYAELNYRESFFIKSIH